MLTTTFRLPAIAPRGGVRASKQRGAVFATALVGLLLVACGVTRHESAPERLDGRWSAEFRAANGDLASGEIILHASPRPSEQCQGDTLACATLVRGQHRISFTSLVGHAIPASAEAAYVAEGGVILYLGACCDRGEISGKGEVDGASFHGEWIEGRISGGRRGWVVMHRRAPLPGTPKG